MDKSLSAACEGDMRSRGAVRSTWWRLYSLGVKQMLTSAATLVQVQVPVEPRASKVDGAPDTRRGIRSRRLDVPVVPGIMPITSSSQLLRFSDACGAEIPRWIRKQVASFGDDSVSIQQFGEEVITRLCRQLLDGGAPGLHFYSMNLAEPTLALWRNLGLPEAR